MEFLLTPLMSAPLYQLIFSIKCSGLTNKGAIEKLKHAKEWMRLQQLPSYISGWQIEQVKWEIENLKKERHSNLECLLNSLNSLVWRWQKLLQSDMFFCDFSCLSKKHR